MPGTDGFCFLMTLALLTNTLAGIVSTRLIAKDSVFLISAAAGCVWGFLGVGFLKRMSISKRKRPRNKNSPTGIRVRGKSPNKGCSFRGLCWSSKDLFYRWTKRSLGGQSEWLVCYKQSVGYMVSQVQNVLNSDQGCMVR